MNFHLNQFRSSPFLHSSPRRVTLSYSVRSHFLCAINGHILKVPLKSPLGFAFEKETIDIEKDESDFWGEWKEDVETD